MKVFKFGGASIKNSGAVKNMYRIISSYNKEQLLIVVSAMGKSTNALEAINQAADPSALVDSLFNYHNNILDNLFAKGHTVYDSVKNIFSGLNATLSDPAITGLLRYDQVVSYGEILSSTIVAAYLQLQGIPTVWLDSRKYIKTDNNYTEGQVDWGTTEKLIQTHLPDKLKEGVILTQGFIGESDDGLTTTLGREGSDFTAAIYATALNAESVCVWKDVPGILNADPKLIPDAVLYEELSYQEAAEMTYYGATVIHPKTIKPLANKKIPLWVKGFDQPRSRGTIIHECDMKEKSPCIIIKNDQCLISFKVLDFTFVNEENLSLIFKNISEAGLKINIMQNSAISFSIVTDNQPHKINAMISGLKDHFDIRYNSGLQLITIKNYTRKKLEEYRNYSNILLEQISRNNYRLVVAP